MADDDTAPDDAQTAAEWEAMMAAESAEGEGDAEDADDAKAKKKAAKQARKNKDARELDPDSPEAMALEELLVMNARYAKDGTVQLAYAFREPTDAHQYDDRVDRSGEAAPVDRRFRLRRILVAGDDGE